MDRLGVPLARAESVAGVVLEAESVTGANQVVSEWNIAQIWIEISRLRS